MPYAFIFSSSILILALSIDDSSSFFTDTIIILFLYLLNYQNLFLIPSYYLCKFLLFYERKKLPNFKEFIPTVFLLITIISSFLFFKIRAQITGIHENMGINWNSGIQNEFIFEKNKVLFDEFLDILIYLPKSIFYHITEDFYNIKFISIIFWLFLIFIIYLIIKNRNYSKVLIFYISAFLVFIFLTLFEITSFGPTRHTLYLLPIFIAFSYISLKLFLNLNKNIFFVVLFPFLFYNSSKILKRSYNFNNHIMKLNSIIMDNPESDILLVSCTYQPFISKSFRNEVLDRKVYFFCGSRFNIINANNKSKKPFNY